MELKTPYATKATKQVEARLISLMKTFHMGRTKAIKKYELVAELYGPEAAKDKSANSRYDRSLRAMIEGINIDGGMICSTTEDGYWWCASIDDGLTAAERNEARALTQLENARRLKQNIITEYGGQMGMFNG